MSGHRQLGMSALTGYVSLDASQRTRDTQESEGDDEERNDHACDCRKADVAPSRAHLPEHGATDAADETTL